jgi:hypothetical protein
MRKKIMSNVHTAFHCDTTIQYLRYDVRMNKVFKKYQTAEV